MASILRRGDSYSVRFKYKDHAGRICEGWESFKTKKEAQDRKISVERKNSWTVRSSYPMQ